jgi:hypothetical protein
MKDMERWGDGDGFRFIEFVVAGLVLVAFVALIVLSAHHRRPVATASNPQVG